MAEPAKAPVGDPKNEITINADGTYSPAGGVVINPGGEVKFSVTYPAGMNVCTIPFGTITFSSAPTSDGGGTIKVGS